MISYVQSVRSRRKKWNSHDFYTTRFCIIHQHSQFGYLYSKIKDKAVFFMIVPKLFFFIKGRSPSRHESSFWFYTVFVYLEKKDVPSNKQMIGGLSKWVFIFDPLFATPEELRRLKSSLELSIAHSICSNELTVKRWSRLMREHYYWGAKKDQIVFFFHHSSWIKRLIFDEMKQIQNLP